MNMIDFSSGPGRGKMRKLRSHQISSEFGIPGPPRALRASDCFRPPYTPRSPYRFGKLGVERRKGTDAEAVGFASARNMRGILSTTMEDGWGRGLVYAPFRACSGEYRQVSSEIAHASIQ